MLTHDLMEVVELVWNSGWVSKKSLLSYVWHAARFKMYGQNTKPADNIETWLFEKTYNLKEISKNDTMSINAEILENLLHHYDTDRWDIHYNMISDLNFKTYRSLSINANYHEQHAIVKDFKENRYQKLRDKNIYQDDWTVIELLTHGFEKQFLNIMNQNQIGIAGKDLFMLFARIVTYYKIYRCQKNSQKKNEKEMNLILQSFKRWKLSEKITYTAKEIEENYYKIFDSGSYGHFLITREEHMGIDLHLVQLPMLSIRKPVDTTFYAGDVWFIGTEPKDPNKKNGYLKLLEVTDEQREEYRKDFKKLLNEK